MNNEMLNYLDEQSKDNTIKIEFNGGNDEGCFALYIGGEEIDYYKYTDIQRQILNKVDSHLGYGSFAGDFYVNGELVYNRETKCFEGRDDYSYSDYKVEDITENPGEYPPLVFQVPLDVPFDIMVIDGSLEYVDVDFLVTNGPLLFDLLNGTAKNMQSEIKHTYRDVIDKLTDKYDGFYSIDRLDEGSIRRSEFVINEEKGVREYRVTTIGFTCETSEENAYSISFED